MTGNENQRKSVADVRGLISNNYVRIKPYNCEICMGKTRLMGN